MRIKLSAACATPGAVAWHLLWRWAITRCVRQDRTAVVATFPSRKAAAAQQTVSIQMTPLIKRPPKHGLALHRAFRSRHAHFSLCSMALPLTPTANIDSNRPPQPTAVEINAIHSDRFALPVPLALFSHEFGPAVVGSCSWCISITAAGLPPARS